jgi:purine-binding chemotaxis protein CheW
VKQEMTKPVPNTEDSNSAAPQAESRLATVTRAIAFFLGGQRYALPIERVNEIQQIVAFSDVPTDDSAVVGMVNLRGRVIPAVDMRRLVGLPQEPYSLDTPMIIVETEGQMIALVVDEVQDVIELPAESMQETPPLHALASRMLGVCRMEDGLLNVLDIDKLLTADAIGEVGEA